MDTTETKPNIDPQHVIATLLEENKTVTENRLYLLALVRQIQAEFEEAKQVWELERESLKADKD